MYRGGPFFHLETSVQFAHSSNHVGRNGHAWSNAFGVGSRSLCVIFFWATSHRWIELCYSTYIRLALYGDRPLLFWTVHLHRVFDISSEKLERPSWPGAHLSGIKPEVPDRTEWTVVSSVSFRPFSWNLVGTSRTYIYISNQFAVQSTSDKFQAYKSSNRLVSCTKYLGLFHFPSL